MEDLIELIIFIIILAIQLMIIGFVCMGFIYIVNLIPFIAFRAIVFGFCACVIYGVIDN